MSVDFSSWPRDQEQSFVVYEERANESTRKAYSLGGIIGAIWLVLCVGIYFGVQPVHKDMTKGMDMTNLTKKSKNAAAPEAPKPAPPAEAPKPAAEAPAAAPAAEETK
jgi:hypothetical protein